MIAYFSLQFSMILRKLKDSGIQPFLGVILIVAVFAFLSHFLFKRAGYAVYLYIALALALLSPLGARKRNDFLKSVFPGWKYPLVRIFENTFVILPFIAFLLYSRLFPAALILTISGWGMALFRKNNEFRFILPTPFSRRPFEFAVGFRKTFYLFPVVYLLVIPAVLYDNFNLGAVLLALLFFILMSFYSKPENEYYVWIFKDDARGFLLRKIKTAWLYATFLTLPVLLVLGWFFPGDIKILIVIQLLGYLYLMLAILAKYTAFPEEMSIARGMLFALSIFFPPLLLAVIPYFYILSIKRLKIIML